MQWTANQHVEARRERASQSIGPTPIRTGEGNLVAALPMMDEDAGPALFGLVTLPPPPPLPPPNPVPTVPMVPKNCSINEMLPACGPEKKQQIVDKASFFCG